MFGSVARGDPRPDSDLDLGVVYRRFDRSGALHRRIAGALAHAIGRELAIEAVDVVDLEAQGPLFCHHVLLEGRIVYEAAPDRRVDFESDAIVRGLDFEQLQTKLDLLRTSLEQLQRIPQSSVDEFRSDFRNVQAALHLLQTSIGALIDLASVLVARLGLPNGV